MQTSANAMMNAMSIQPGFGSSVPASVKSSTTATGLWVGSGSVGAAVGAALVGDSDVVGDLVGASVGDFDGGM